MWFFCLVEWEEHVLMFLKSSGRARSWNDKQRAQNLWTKKGYDLAYKACNCTCGKGHLRKNLDYVSQSEDVSSHSCIFVIVCIFT